MCWCFRFSTCYIGEYFFWTQALDLPWPMPFNNIPAGSFAVSSQFASIWFSFPAEWRSQSDRRAQMFWLVCICSTAIVFVNCHNILIVGFQKNDAEWQWIMVAPTLLIREASGKTLAWFGKRAMPSDPFSITFVSHSFISIYHAVFLTIVIGGVTNVATVFVFLATDTANNIRCCWVVYRLHLQGEWYRCEEAATGLLNNEYIEFVAPTAYLLCFVIIRYSSNAAQLGNFGRTQWTFAVVPLEDMSTYILTVSVLVVVYVVSLCCSAVILWRTCQISLWRVFLFLQGEYGIVNAVSMVVCFLTATSFTVIAYAHDYTLQFDWLRTKPA